MSHSCILPLIDITQGFISTSCFVCILTYMKDWTSCWNIWIVDCFFHLYTTVSSGPLIRLDELCSKCPIKIITTVELQTSSADMTNDTVFINITSELKIKMCEMTMKRNKRSTNKWELASQLADVVSL